VWLILWWCDDLIETAFSASDKEADLIIFYMHFMLGAFVFNGTLFVSNATFNNLRHPHWATGFNFGRALLGTIPAVYFGAQWYGARGVMAGEAVGAVLFGLLATAGAFVLIKRLALSHQPMPDAELAAGVQGLETERESPV
jgi:Na+-driven multidrug efflux pump